MAPRAAARGKKSSNSAYATPIKTQMAIVNWENVLVSLDWMKIHLGLGTTTATIDPAVIYLRSRVSPELPRIFTAIEDRIMDLLAEIERSIQGPMFIVSEYTSAYVELVCSLFFPRLTAALRSVTSGGYVIGTSDTQLTILEIGQWKVNLLRTVVIERLIVGFSVADAMKSLARPQSGKIGVVALCATKTDVGATLAIRNVAPNAVIKCVRVVAGEPNHAPRPLGSLLRPEDFYVQLQTLTQFVKHAVAANELINCEL